MKVTPKKDRALTMRVAWRLVGLVVLAGLVIWISISTNADPSGPIIDVPKSPDGSKSTRNGGTPKAEPIGVRQFQESHPVNETAQTTVPPVHRKPPQLALQDQLIEAGLLGEENRTSIGNLNAVQMASITSIVNDYLKERAAVERMIDGRALMEATKIAETTGLPSETTPTDARDREEALKPTNEGQIVVIVSGTSLGGKPFDNIVRINPGDSENIETLRLEMRHMRDDAQVAVNRALSN